MKMLSPLEDMLVDIVHSTPQGVWSHQLGNTKITYDHARQAEAKGWLTVYLSGEHWFACS